MLNRQQRRLQSKKGLTLTKQQEVFVNEAIKQNYYIGLDAGKAQAVKTCYAAACLAMRDVYGFGRKRVCRMLRMMDKHVIETLASEEAIDEVFKKLKLRISFSDPFSNIEEGN